MSSRTFPQAVLFDHDGTLMDTERGYDETVASLRNLVTATREVRERITD